MRRPTRSTRTDTLFAYTTVFLSGARDFAEDMQSRGYRVDVVDSKAGRDHNSMVLDKDGNGELDMIVSVKMINEGLDVPATRAVLILRESTSEVEYMQMVGRKIGRASCRERVCKYV